MKRYFKCYMFLALILSLFASISFATPFEGNSVSVTARSVASMPANILDVEVALASGITEKEGFPKQGTVNVGDSTLRLRSWPWGDVKGSYTTGSPLTVLGESGEFYLVEINGQQGYMHKNYVSTADKEASGVEPYYPGDTKSGGALALKEGIAASKDGAAGKTPKPAVVNEQRETNTAGRVSTGSNGKVVINVPQKCQRQVNCPAPNSACGPTSLAMVLSYYTGKDVSELASNLWNICGSTASDGTGHAGLIRGAAHYGFPNAKMNWCVSESWVRDKIKAGKPLVAHVKGHYVVIKGIDDSGRIYFNDPWPTGVERSMSFSEFSAWWRGAGTHPCLTID